MSVAFLSLPQLPFSRINQLESHNCKPCGRALPIPRFSFVYGKAPWAISKNLHTADRNRTHNSLKPVARECMNSNNEPVTEDDTTSVEWIDLGEEYEEDMESPWEEGEDSEEDYEEEYEEEYEDDMESPWEGAVIYKRNSYNLHLEFCTTLERLGLRKLSSEISQSKASAMGLRITKAVKDYPDGTPVQISIDVTRRIKNIRLDGIVKTVITCRCFRCGEPTVEGVFCNFTLLLTSEPVEEPEVIDIMAEMKAKSYRMEEDDEDSSIDLDDRLYFPPEAKEVDISKYIRDLVHLEIPLSALCDPGCKGICFTCGTNFNTDSCDCDEDQPEEIGKGSRPLANLRQLMQEK